MKPANRKELPEGTGVYLFWAEDLLYVGKARNIRKRVADHFRSPQKHWIEEVERIEFLLLPNEEEALLSERELIARKKPRYNIRLRDDRSYPQIAVSLEEDFPRVYLTRERHRPGRTYFGPWTDARRARQIFSALHAIYPFRSCTGKNPGRAQNPCLDYYIDRCQAPCVGKVSKNDYRAGIEEILLFLRGNRSRAEGAEKERMEKAAREKNFEAAAIHRDRLRAIERVSDRGRAWGRDRNIVHFSGEALTLLEIREGRIAEKRTLLLQSEGDLEDALDLIPDLDRSLPLVSESKNKEDRELLRLAEENTRAQVAKDHRGESSLQDALLALASSTGKTPARIEGYDIANLGEQNTVAGIVFFREGRQRHSLALSLPQGDRPDDYQNIRDAMHMRVESWHHHKALSPFDAKRDPDLARRPDLVLIDGGPGQLRAALEGGREFWEEGTSFLSLAKREEEIFSPSGLVEIALPGRELLQRVRDAVHRVANSKHQKERSLDMLRSPLEKIPGIGPVRRGKLLQHFSGMEGLREASLEEISAVPGISSALAKKIHGALAE